MSPVAWRRVYQLCLLCLVMADGCWCCRKKNNKKKQGLTCWPQKDHETGLLTLKAWPGKHTHTFFWIIRKALVCIFFLHFKWEIYSQYFLNTIQVGLYETFSKSPNCQCLQVSCSTAHGPHEGANHYWRRAGWGKGKLHLFSNILNRFRLTLAEYIAIYVVSKVISI